MERRSLCLWIETLQMWGVSFLGNIGLTSYFPFLIAFLINIQFLDQVNISSISQLIRSIVNVFQKLLKCFNGTTILAASFVRSAVVSLKKNTYFIIEWPWVYKGIAYVFLCNTVWFIFVIFPQTSIFFVTFTVFKQIVIGITKS